MIRPLPTVSTTACESLEVILGRSQKLQSIQFDGLYWAFGEEVSAHTWIKQNLHKVRENSQSGILVTITDYDKKIVTQYSESDKTGFFYSQPDLGPTLFGETLDILEHNPKIVGYETIGNMPCIIIEYAEDDGAGWVVTIKLWIWTIYGLPIKYEGTLNNQMFIIVNVDNISFNNVTVTSPQ